MVTRQPNLHARALLAGALFAANAGAYTPLCHQQAKHLEQLLKTAELFETEGKPLTRLEQLTESRLISREALVDPWGTPYVLWRRDELVVIATAGPDTRLGTSDDFDSTMERSAACERWPESGGLSLTTWLMLAGAILIAGLAAFSLRNRAKGSEAGAR